MCVLYNPLFNSHKMDTQQPIAPSELIINPDGSIFHLHVKPEQLADKVILVGEDLGL